MVPNILYNNCHLILILILTILPNNGDGDVVSEWLC